MSKQTEALKLALEVLEEINKLSIGENAICLPAEIDTAMDAIREALAEQPAQQQEPVAWVDLLKEAEKIVRGKVLWKRFIDGTPLANDIAVWMADFAQQHTSPPASKPWVGLTDEEYSQLHDGFHQQGKLLGWVVDQVEAKLREKNEWR